jgi:hypothetical protein
LFGKRAADSNTNHAFLAMKLALLTSCNNEWSEAPSTAYLELTPTGAKAVLSLMDMATAFRSKADEARLSHRFFTVSIGAGPLIPDFRLLEVSFDFQHAPDSDQPVLVMPADFDPDSIPDENEWRVECHRIELDEGDVRFTALSRHGSDEFTTAELTRAMLQAIAEDRDPGLGAAVLAAADEVG